MLAPPLNDGRASAIVLTLIAAAHAQPSGPHFSAARDVPRFTGRGRRRRQIGVDRGNQRDAAPARAHERRADPHLALVLDADCRPRVRSGATMFFAEIPRRTDPTFTSAPRSRSPRVWSARTSFAVDATTRCSPSD